MGSVQTDVQGNNSSDAATYSIADVSANTLIQAAKFTDIATKVNQERVRRGSSNASFSFTGAINDSEIQALINGIEGPNPPATSNNYTENPGTVSAPGSGNNTNVAHAAEVAIPETNAGPYTGGIRDLTNPIKASEINSIIDKLQAAGAVCTCNCNYCTCNCNYCTCNCNYACTCNCNY
ncbi:hypothetical protein N9D61_10125 [Planktomarina sp.]|jgi:hypothetical protein|nr:hypothetical protein [Planktomarina sp.]